MKDSSNPASDQDRRKYLRIPLDVAVQCHLIREGKPAEIFDGRSVNLSAGGLSVRGAQSMQEGETLVVSFSLPERPSAGGELSPLSLLQQHKPRLLAMRARVVWCTPQAGEQFDLGMQFITVNDHAHRPLLYFLEDYQL